MMTYFFDKLKITVSKTDRYRLINYNQSLVLRSRKCKIFNNAKSTIIKLSKKYELAIISDTGFESGKIIRSLLKRHNLQTFFSSMLFSDEIKKSKPNKIIFNLALQKTSSTNLEAVHIGDNEKTDIIGAYNLEIKSILFNSKSKKTKADYIASNWKEIEKIFL